MGSAEVDYGRSGRGLDRETVRVTSGEPVEVVSHEGECGRVVAAAFRVLNEEILGGKGRPVARFSKEWAVLRMGP